MLEVEHPQQEDLCSVTYVFWNSLIMEVCFTEEVLISGGGCYKSFNKIC
jgi:hypothetical protein